MWLALLWSEKADEQGNERYILIIAYMIGLATDTFTQSINDISMALLIYLN